MVNTFKNNFGELNENDITLFTGNGRQIIYLKEFVKVQFVKRQKYHFNYIFFLSSFCLLIFLKYNNLTHFSQFIILSLIMILLVAGYLFKAFQYRFILITKNYFKEIKVSKKMSKDAENLAWQIGKMV